MAADAALQEEVQQAERALLAVREGWCRRRRKGGGRMHARWMGGEGSEAAALRCASALTPVNAALSRRAMSQRSIPVRRQSAKRTRT